MKLRTRIALSFFAVSVVPLAAVTAYNYSASAAALKRAEAAQADRMALEMRNRVGSVVTDIGDRVDRLWRLRGALTPDGDQATGSELSAAMATRLRTEAISLLAEAAPMVERIDIVPSAAAVPAGSGAPPAPAAVPTRPAPSAATRGGQPRGGGRPGPPGGPERRGPGGGPRDGRGGTPPPAPLQGLPPFSLDLRLSTGAAGSTDELIALSADEIAAWQRAIQRQADRAPQRGNGGPSRPAPGLDAATLNAQAEALAAQRERHLAALAAGKALEFELHRGPDVVGRATATVSRKRLIETVLSLARRDRGELPFVVDGEGQIDTISADAQRTLAGLGLDVSGLARDASPLARTFGDYMVVMRRDPSGIVFGIARPVGESLREMRRTSMINLGLGTLLIAVACIAIVPLSNRLTRELAALTEGVRRLTRGERTTRVTIESHDEVGVLAAAFNKMAADLEVHEKALVEQERLRRELELCRQIQNEMLPHGPLRMGWTEVTGISVPAREVGGDFFNYFVLPNGELALLVGDVSGKGVGAALLMANIQATLRAKLPLELDLATLVDVVDRDIAANTPPEVFVTLFIAIFNQPQRTLRYVNAGHNPQFLAHASGAIDMLGSTGMPVGMMPGQGYREQRVEIVDSALLFLYTDGAVDVENEAGDAFGAERLLETIRGREGARVEDVLAQVESALKAFRGSTEPPDDATIMAVRLDAR